MYRVAILGCENSHADGFLKAVLQDKLVEDVTFLGVYSDDREAAQKLHDTFGVPVAEHYDDFVGKVDGILITARHGDNHYKYAKPYLESGIPMFIDKPITCSEEDALAFMADLKKYHVPVCGGSVCGLFQEVQELKKEVQARPAGSVLGGYFRAPINPDNPYGGFFFYTQHLVQMMGEIFGYYPESVQMMPKDKVYTGVVRYRDFDVSICYTAESWLYFAGISLKDGFICKECKDFPFQEEFMEFYRLLQGQPQPHSYEDFFAPVYILNAMEESVRTGKEVRINTPSCSWARTAATVLERQDNQLL